MTDLQLTHRLPPSSDAAIMTDTHIPHLPNEILCEIASFVADEDILRLRLSAKIFHVATANRFAMTFFENRAYDITPKGLKALVKITENQPFARHIRTIIIGHGGKFYLTKHNIYLEEAFQNLASIGNTISVGMRQVRKCRKYERERHTVLDNTIRFFHSKVLGAAFRVGMPLGNLVVDTQSAPQNRALPSVSDDWVESFTRHFFRTGASNNQLQGLRVKLGSTEPNPSSSGHILVNNRVKRLEVLQAGVWAWHCRLPTQYYQGLHEIVLEDCEVYGVCLKTMLETSSYVLNHLTLYNVRLKAVQRRRPETWASLFTAPTIPLRVLKSCKFGNLWDETHVCWLEGGDMTIQASTRAQVSTVLSNLATGNRTFTLDG